MNLSRNTIKIIAILLMVIDHIGLFLLNNSIICRALGRLSFPLFVFLLLDGFYRTRNIRRYAARILFLWALSIVPYNLAFYGNMLSFYQNVFAALFLYLCLFCIIDNVYLNTYQKAIGAIVFVILAEWLGIEYGWYGVALAVVMFNYRQYGKDLALAQILLLTTIYALLTQNYLSILASFAIVLLPPNQGEFLESRCPNKLLSWSMYFFYPVHLWFFALLRF